MSLLLIALFGLVVPNGLLVYWLLNEYNGLTDVVQNKLDLAFILDAFMVLGVLASYFARRPIGRVKWFWFVLLSLAGGMGFSLPFYWWLNKREAS